MNLECALIQFYSLIRTKNIALERTQKLVKTKKFKNQIKNRQNEEKKRKKDRFSMNTRVV